MTQNKAHNIHCNTTSRRKKTGVIDSQKSFETKEIAISGYLISK